MLGGFVFVAVPLIVSTKVPIISARYWLVGAPLLVTMITFLAGAWLSEIRDQSEFLSLTVPKAGVVIAAGFLVVSSVSGFLAARQFTALKPIWRGAEIVAPLLKSCPLGSVRALRAGKPNDTIRMHAIISGAAENVFVDAKDPALPESSEGSRKCPVVGWAEHIFRSGNYIAGATDAELLHLLGLSATERDVEIRRHSTGFVVLRRRD